MMAILPTSEAWNVRSEVEPQVMNAVMLPLHVVALQLLARDPAIMGDARSTPTSQFAAWVSIALVTACVGALAWSWIGARG